MTDRNEAIAAIRTALRARSGKAWSVKGNKGTAWGWIDISSPPARRGCARFHEEDYASRFRCKLCGESTTEDTGCAAHVCDDKCYRAYITPEDRAELSALLGGIRVHAQGVSIAASSEYRNEYIARAAGLTPAVVGTPYWD